jgi:hypothetical protein
VVDPFGGVRSADLAFRAVTGGRLVIIGDGIERRRPQGLARDDVEFVGYIDEERNTLFALPAAE